MTFWVRHWLEAFALTLCIEVLVASPLLAVEPRVRKRLAGVLLVNLATHPIVWFVWPGLLLPLWARVTLAELFAFVVEAWAYGVIWPALSSRRSLLIALCANAASFVAGMLWRPFWR